MARSLGMLLILAALASSPGCCGLPRACEQAGDAEIHEAVVTGSASRVSLEAEGARIAPGGTATLRIRATIEPRWHIYGMRDSSGQGVPTRILVNPPQGSGLGLVDVIEPEPEQKNDAFGEPVLEHHGVVTFLIGLAASEGAAVGAHEVAVSFEYAACDPQVCEPPREIHLRVPVHVAEAGGS